MKVNKLWIPMIIFGIIGGAAKLCDTFLNRNGNTFFLNSDTCNLICLISVALVLIIGYLLGSSDRKITVKLSPEKCRPAGIFGFIASVGICGSGVITLLSINSPDSNITGYLGLAMVVFGVLGGIVMLYESCILFTGHNSMRKRPLIGLLVPLWCCFRLISYTVTYSQYSLRVTEMTDVVSCVLLLLFLYYQALYFAELMPAQALRRSTVYGIVYIMCSTITVADLLIKMFHPDVVTANVDVQNVQPTVSNVLSCVIDAAFCLYALFMIPTMHKHAVLTDPTEEDVNDEDETFLGILKEEDEPEDEEASSLEPSAAILNETIPEPEQNETTTPRSSILSIEEPATAEEVIQTQEPETEETSPAESVTAEEVIQTQEPETEETSPAESVTAETAPAEEIPTEPDIPEENVTPSPILPEVTDTTTEQTKPTEETAPEVPASAEEKEPESTPIASRSYSADDIGLTEPDQSSEEDYLPEKTDDEYQEIFDMLDNMFTEETE